MINEPTSDNVLGSETKKGTSTIPPLMLLSVCSSFRLAVNRFFGWFFFLQVAAAIFRERIPGP